jgi:DNA polymerase III gamma/tau subunit
MSIYNTLRSIPSQVASMLMNRGFMKELSAEEQERMNGEIKALVEEWFGASSIEEKPKKEKKTKTKAEVVTSPPAVIDRAYLETRNVSELKELGKDCPAIKGRKPRAELIELVLQHLSGSSPVSAEPVSSPVASAAEASDGSDEELREEPPPAPVEAPKEKKGKATKEKKEKEAKPAKKEKAKPAKKEKAEKVESESDDENTVELKEWFHPSEMSKPKEERQRYFIDPKTNELFHPDRLQDGEPEWRWDEETSEITPIN